MANNGIVRVKCKCPGPNNWVTVEGKNHIKNCWKCMAQVKFEGDGSGVKGKVLPFMKFEWEDSQVDVVSNSGRRFAWR